MAEFVDSSALRLAGYVMVAVLSLWWGVRERRGIAALRLDWWPGYWFLSAALLATMGIGRAGALGDLLGEFGREQARESGWYDTRRTVQAAVVIAVAVVWLIGVVLAVVRVPPRRRRYLPHVIVLSTIIAFAAIRLVSLHHVDTVLYRRDLGGVRIVSIAELALLVAAVVAMAVWARFPSEPVPDGEGELSDVGPSSGART